MKAQQRTTTDHGARARSRLILSLVCCAGLFLCSGCTDGRDPPLFDGPLPQETLERYLSRAITLSDLLQPDSFFAQYGYSGCFEYQLGMIERIKPLFLGRAALVYGDEPWFVETLPDLARRVAQVHAIDPSIIVQGAVFEVVTEQVSDVPVPPDVLAAFGLDPDNRTFCYEDMLAASGGDQLAPGISVPDMTRRETRLWYYFVCTRFIDAGIEAIHLGQLEWVSENDREWRETFALIEKIRAYAAQYARRHTVVLDAHTTGMVREGALLLDFHSMPLRLFLSESSDVGVDIDPEYPPASSGYSPSIYTRSAGGLNPNGWHTAANPFLVEFDHGYSQGCREQNTGPEFIDGYDEITWFSLQEESHRNAILIYLAGRVPAADPAGHLQMPGMRMIWAGHSEHPPDWYFAARAGAAFPGGYDQEETIREIWSSGAAQ